MGAPQCWAHTSRFALMRQRVIDAKAKNRRVLGIFKNDSLSGEGEATKICREFPTFIRWWIPPLVPPPPPNSTHHHFLLLPTIPFPALTP